MHNVFVYGTLKRGFPNFDAHMQTAEFVGAARTVTAYPLVIGGSWRTPYLIDEPGNGHRVAGEIFAVDGQTLALLDQLEGLDHPKGYHRTTIALELIPSQATMNAEVYLKHRDRIDSITAILDGTYALDPGYVIPSLRG